MLHLLNIVAKCWALEMKFRVKLCLFAAYDLRRARNVNPAVSSPFPPFRGALCCSRAARRTRSGMQLRVSPTMASGAAVPSPAYPSTAVFAAGTTGSICDGASLYYPALLSDALEFFGAGLCWRLDKASIALHLPAHDDRGAAVWGSEEDVSQPTAGEVAGNEGVLVIRAPPLHGASDPTILLMAHVLQTDAWKMEEISAVQVIRWWIGGGNVA